MTADEVLENLVVECHVDHVGLWEIVDAVRFDLGATAPAEIREMTLRLVHRLVRERDILAGHPTPDGRHFLPWNSSFDQTANRIENEWSALGREPMIGELAWFTIAENLPNDAAHSTGTRIATASPDCKPFEAGQAQPIPRS